MSKKNFIHAEDVTFTRTSSVMGQERIDVLDSEGDCQFSLPPSLSDEEAMQVVHVINNIFAKGCEVGELSRSREIARLLGVKCEALQ